MAGRVADHVFAMSVAILAAFLGHKTQTLTLLRMRGHKSADRLKFTAQRGEG
jgi:hypothetical protein